MKSDESLRDELLAEVAAVAPILTEHAPQSEKLGCVDEPTIDALRKTRLLRFACPRDLGGDEADPLTVMEVLEAVTRIDGSAGWTLGILALTSAMAGAFLPVKTAQRIFAKGVPPMAGMIAPRGKAEPVDGGYRVTGRWAFGSGIHHADLVIAGAFLPVPPLPAGIRMVLLPRAQVVIHDNWQVAGLRASGSCDYSIENMFVPGEMTFPLSDMIFGNAVTGGAAFRLGLPALVTGFHMAIALGIARRALDEITEQAVEKGRGFPPSPLPSHPHFQFALGKAELQLASARALAVQVLSSVWTEARAGRVPPPPMQAEARAAAVYITEVAQRVTTAAFQSAGGGALFDTNPLQRCFRDVPRRGATFRDEPVCLSRPRPVQARPARRQSNALANQGPQAPIGNHLLPLVEAALSGAASAPRQPITRFGRPDNGAVGSP
jgi:alkylation response protein AidB-like acyl-CoA dehydrogenase